MSMMKTFLTLIAALILVSGCGAPPTATAANPASNTAANWADYLGPQSDGHAPLSHTQGKLPVRWSEDHGVVWKTPIHDRGWSSPVIWGNQIWMTTATADGRKMYAVCLDKKSGAVVYDLHLFDVKAPEKISKVNSYATPSCAIEEGRVYCYFGTYGLACIDTASGEVLWTRRDIKLDHMEGPGSSPVLYKDLLIFHCDGTDVQFVIALNKTTGQTVWKTKRSAPGLSVYEPHFRKSFSTPIIAQVGGRDLMISTGAQAAYAYEPLTGKEVWRVQFKKGWSVGGRPFVGEGWVYLMTGYGDKTLMAIDPNGQGDVTETHVRWRMDRQVPVRSTPVYHEGLIYMLSDKSYLTCVDAKTGEIVYVERLGREFDASPLVGEGRIYLLDSDGNTTVIHPGREFKVMATNVLESGAMGCVAVSDGALFIRTMTHVYRLEN